MGAAALAALPCLHALLEHALVMLPPALPGSWDQGMTPVIRHCLTDVQEGSLVMKAVTLGADSEHLLH